MNIEVNVSAIAVITVEPTGKFPFVCVETRPMGLFLGCTITQKKKSKTIQCIKLRNYDVIGDK